MNERARKHACNLDSLSFKLSTASLSLVLKSTPPFFSLTDRVCVCPPAPECVSMPSKNIVSQALRAFRFSSSVSFPSSPVDDSSPSSFIKASIPRASSVSNALLNSSSFNSSNWDPEEPGRDGGTASTRVFCRGLPTGGLRADVGGGAGIGFGENCSKTSERILNYNINVTKYVDLPSRSSTSSSILTLSFDCIPLLET